MAKGSFYETCCAQGHAIARDQLDRLVNRWWEDGRTIHLLRVDCKRLIALWRLFIGLDLELAEARAKAIRAASRSIGKLRDLQVMREKLVHLGKNPEAVSLAADLPREEADAMVEALCADMSLWKDLLGVRGKEVQRGEKQLLTALEQQQRKVWAQASALSGDSSNKDLHELRREVKSLKFQLDALGLGEDGLLHPYREQLRDLGHLLGLHNDYVVLVKHLKKNGKNPGKAKKQRKRQRRALDKDLPDLLGLPPADFARLLQASCSGL